VALIAFAGRHLAEGILWTGLRLLFSGLRAAVGYGGLRQDERPRRVDFCLLFSTGWSLIVMTGDKEKQPTKVNGCLLRHLLNSFFSSPTVPIFHIGYGRPFFLICLRNRT
jgi:hypothetical protein